MIAHIIKTPQPKAKSLSNFVLGSKNSPVERLNGSISRNAKSLGSPKAEWISRPIVTREPSTKPIPDNLFEIAITLIAAPPAKRILMTSPKSLSPRVNIAKAYVIIPIFQNVSIQYPAATLLFRANTTLKDDDKKNRKNHPRPILLYSSLRKDKALIRRALTANKPKIKGK